jgi:hypothetical protein
VASDDEFEKSDIAVAAKVLAQTIADHTNAQSAVMIALLSLLVKRGILTQDDVKVEILDSLEALAQSVRAELPQDEKDLREVRGIDVIEAVVSQLRARLFPAE